MAHLSEAKLEANLIRQLSTQGWRKAVIPDAEALWDNLRMELGAFNDLTFSDAEFGQVQSYLSKGNVLQRAALLRKTMHVTRDDGSSAYIRLFNTQDWCRNRFQVTSQVTLQGRRENRYDVTLLVNGIPLGQIELKRPGVELKAAFDQINRYQHDSFAAAGGLFQFVQIFMISSGVNTRYYANNRKQTFKHTFTWSTPENEAINRLEDFAEEFLDTCFFSKMIARFMVIHETNKQLMVLRPYQVYAVEKILERVKIGQGHGYVWHTTGSGKTLTSFKAAQILKSQPDVDKVLFVVDRADLDYQTIQEFNKFQKGCVDSTESTLQLVDQLESSSSDNKLIVTTIQKLNTALTTRRYEEYLAAVRKGRVVLIFDECHRSQFGDTHKRIREFFLNAQMFGFTGTPILKKNAMGGRTTADLFERRLHHYVITNAIHDDNVLKFSIEYLNANEADGKDELSASSEQLRAFHQSKGWVDKVVKWIIDNHDRKTHKRRFGAILATSSVDQAVAYYEELRRRQEGADKPLKIATVFTYAANEDDLGANGLIDDPEFPTEKVKESQMPRRDKLQSFVEAYNSDFGTNESVLNGSGFYSYYRDIAKRMRLRDKEGFDPEKGIDILIVVNMFLTGFDAKTLNTVYVDKNLKFHGLIQAFSRSNRVLDSVKSHGNIVCFRNLRDETDEAITLFGDEKARDTVLVGTYDEHLEEYKEAAAALKGLVSAPDAVDHLLYENDQADFAKIFRRLLRLRNVLSGFSEFAEDDLPIKDREFNEFKSKYLDLAESAVKDTASGDGLAAVDFELELLGRVEINVGYILGLVAKMHRAGSSPMEDGISPEDLKAKVFEQIAAHPQLRGKRPLIEKFIETCLDELDPEADVAEAFEDFVELERGAYPAQFSSECRLDPDKAADFISDMEFHGHMPTTFAIQSAFDATVRLATKKELCQKALGMLKDYQSMYW